MFEWKTIIKVAAAAGLVAFAVKLSAGLAEVLIEYPIWRGWLGGMFKQRLSRAGEYSCIRV